MKKFICYLIKMSIITLMVLAFLVIAALSVPRGVFDTSYQSVLQKKYEYFVKIDVPKIVIIGGSNTAFGIDEELIEKSTGYKVTNLGLHAGFGAIVPTELSKANLNEGDIVLLAYEWGWQNAGYFDMFGTDLVMSGIEHKIEMYRYIPTEHYSKIIGYLPKYIEKKWAYDTVSGVYSSSSFDDIGRMILERPQSTMVYEGNESTYGKIDVSNGVIANDVISYLTKYKEYVEEQGASCYFVAPPFYSGATECTKEQFQTIVSLEEELIGIDYISDPYAYLFPQEYIFDTPYHCTSAGELYRTELLINDLKAVLQ